MVTVIHEGNAWTIVADCRESTGKLCIRRGGLMRWVGEGDVR